MTVLMTAAIGLISGVIGAIGYSHFLGSTPGEPSSSGSRPEAASSQGSSLTRKSSEGASTDFAKATSSEASKSSPMLGVRSAPETGDLRQQISDLNQRIDQLGERVERLQQLLGLAVPLLQRMVPKQ